MNEAGLKKRGETGGENSQERNLKAPQSIIHIKHRITLQQYKYWILLLQELREQMTAGERPDEDGFYSMPMSRLVDYIGYTPKKSEIWADLLALKNETIAFNVLNKDGEKEKYGAGFISEWKVSNSFVRFKFPSFLENLMRGLEAPKAIFSLLNWQIFNHFTGKYEAIIYKLCKDYAGVGKTPKMAIKEFREYLGLGDGEYSEFMRLNEWCITKPVKKINESEISDITVTPDFFRQGRKVIGLHFLVSYKKQQALPLPEAEETTAFQGAKVAINPTDQATYLSKRTPEEIALCIARANDYGESQEKKGEPVNYGGLYRRAIEGGWHVRQIEFQAQEDAKKAKEEAEKQAKKTKEEAEKQAKEKAQQEYNELQSAFDSLPEDEKEQIVSKLLDGALPAFVKEYKNKKYDGTLIRGKIHAYMKQRKVGTE